MSKLLGYILSAAGIVLIIISQGQKFLNITLPEQIKPLYIMIAGLVIVLIGIFLILSKPKKTKIKQAGEEVPIYQGEGKKRKIVGYKKG